ncbi:GNAT family N-acetyltransferase [Pseudopedobacter beijingensis]|uniref:GNAT family N-acetyltransferase n=1 Tax=Pseudopedobacter beijingensis TaxID=1207056 RepID=A0ABW4IIA7_9SPHI
MTHILDNPVWNALNTGNKDLSVGEGRIRLYRSDISPFIGLEENSSENLFKLYEYTRDIADTFGIVAETEIDIPHIWNVAHKVPILQMICQEPLFRKEISANIKKLSDEHIPQMLALTELTRPGPFKDRTIEFGHYQGIFEDDGLVAMAGQRMHALPYAEISAVCTHPQYLGLGYAGQLMMSQIKRILEQDQIPFLHVTISNKRAIKIYESMGFKIRKEMFVYFIKK